MDDRLSRIEELTIKLNRSELALQESNDGMIKLFALWESTFNSINDLISVHDLTGTIVEANEAFRKKYGNDAIGKKCYEIVHDKNTYIDECPSLKILQSPNKNIIYEPLSIDIELDTEWYELTCSPLKNLDSITGIVHIMKNITQRKHNEEEIRRNQDRYKKLMELSSVATLIYENNKIIDVNQKFIELLDLPSREAVLGKDLLEIGICAKSKESIIKAVCEDEKRKFRIKIETLKGNNKFVGVHVRRLDTNGVVAVMCEITEETKKRKDD